jgi:hypothetical protein
MQNTTKTIVIALSLSLAINLPLPTFAKTTATCADGYVKWKKLSGKKAVATTEGRKLSAPGTYCGFSFGYPSSKLAAAEAVRRCTKVHREYNVKSSCRVLEAK